MTPVDSVQRRIGLPPTALFARYASGDEDCFYGVAAEFLRYFIDLCDLQPDERVLDVGCGAGRMALALSDYLSDHAEYEGFDVASDAVSWCTSAITPVLSNFRFRHLDVFNGAYNPDGATLPGDLRFPYGDDHFDFAFATSLFTHMHAEETEHYLGEMARVLRPGGRCLTTWFVLDDECRARIEEGRAMYSFRHRVGDSYAEKAKRTEAAVAYEEHVLMGMLERVGLAVRGGIHRGAWSGRRDFLSGQDILVASAG